MTPQEIAELAEESIIHHDNAAAHRSGWYRHYPNHSVGPYKTEEAALRDAVADLIGGSAAFKRTVYRLLKAAKPARKRGKKHDR